MYKCLHETIEVVPVGWNNIFYSMPIHNVGWYRFLLHFFHSTAFIQHTSILAMSNRYAVNVPARSSLLRPLFIFSLGGNLVAFFCRYILTNPSPGNNFLLRVLEFSSSGWASGSISPDGTVIPLSAAPNFSADFENNFHFLIK